MQPITIWRRISQVAFFVLTGEWLAVGWLRCPYGVPFVSCASCPLADCPGRWLQPWFIGIAALSGLLAGRAFCGWVCPMGLIQDALGRIKRSNATLSARFAAFDEYAKYFKYAYLAIVVVLIFSLNLQLGRPHEYVVRSPSAFSIGSYQVAWGLGEPWYQVRFWVLVVAIVGGLLVSRLWCRYLCPLGALLSIFSKTSIFKIGCDTDACSTCGKYPRECIQHTVPDTVDCVMCGECVQGCPKGALKLQGRYGRPPKHEVEDKPTEAAG